MSSPIADLIFENIQKCVALYLLELEAIKFRVTPPFTLTSKNLSPIYINCRRLISSTTFSDLFALGARQIIEREQIKFDVIAGGETAGIPFAALLARALGFPMIYVRKATMEHGLASRIEGFFQSGKTVLLVEDLITDAGSKLSFINAIRAAGAAVSDVLVVFDRLQGGKEALESEGIRLHALSDMNITLDLLRNLNLVSSEILQEVLEYLKSPLEWHERYSKYQQQV